MQSREMRKTLGETTARLPRPLRETFSMCAISGLSISETAKALGLTVPATKTRLFRARSVMKTALKNMRDNANGAVGRSMVACSPRFLRRQAEYDDETSKGHKIAALNAQARKISRFHLRDLFARNLSRVFQESDYGRSPQTYRTRGSIRIATADRCHVPRNTKRASQRVIEPFRAAWDSRNT
jgi:AraC-like DNA-binding protein